MERDKCLFVILLVTVNCFFSGHDAIKDEDEYLPYIVTTSEEIPKYYLTVRSQNPQHSSKLTTEIKEKICGRLHHFFEGSYGILSTELYKDNLKSEPIFKEIFEKKSMNPFTKATEYSYVNTSKSRPFRVGEAEYTENTFVCLKYTHDENHRYIFFTYYVSDYSYNVNNLLREPKIEGRFVFVDGKIHALAERNANYKSMKGEISLYSKERTGHPSAIQSYNDPVCKQDPWRKRRFCASVCMYWAGGCKGKVAVGGCEKQTIPSIRRLPLLEWFLECEFHYGKAYVSRGFKDNEFFVWRLEDGKPELFQKVSNVSVAIYHQ